MSAVDARRNIPVNVARLAVMRNFFSANFTILEEHTGVKHVTNLRSEYMAQYPSGRYYRVPHVNGYVMVGETAIFYL